MLESINLHFPPEVVLIALQEKNQIQVRPRAKFVTPECTQMKVGLPAQNVLQGQWQNPTNLDATIVELESTQASQVGTTVRLVKQEQQQQTRAWLSVQSVVQESMQMRV
jgi:hypothetical protein